MTRRDVLTGGAAAVLAGRSAGAQGKSLAERLGFGPEDRLLMIHADDIGMCHSVNEASTRALTEGVAASGSVMVPCPWFPEIAAWSREHPDADLGLHLTLTSEWRYYRWRPVAPLDQVKGLLDAEGFLWRSEEDVKKHATAKEVEIEIRAQVARARQFGMKPTHLDSHMGTLFVDAGFFEAYVRVSRETGIMAMLPGPTPEVLEAASGLGFDYAAAVRKLEGEGHVALDRLSLGLTGKSLEERRESLAALVRDLKPGVTELIVHLAGDDEEIRHVTGNWARRFHEYRLLTDPATRELLERHRVRRVGYRELSRLWKAGAPPA